MRQRIGVRSLRGVVPADGREMTCPACGPDDGILEIGFDLDRVRAAWQAEPLDQPAAEPLALSRAAAARAGARFRRLAGRLDADSRSRRGSPANWASGNCW